jgi:NAD-dependent deacetylase
MSRESGIPTFRDAMEGLWANFDPQELATEDGFRRDSRRVWSWYAWRRKSIAEVRPNAGHFAVAEMEKVIPALTVVTQNVDGLHTDAGSADVIEVHGSIRRVKCLDRGHLFSGELRPYEEGDEQDPPACPACGSPLRPDVVWFGGTLRRDAADRHQRHGVACGRAAAGGAAVGSPYHRGEPHAIGAHPCGGRVPAGPRRPGAPHAPRRNPPAEGISRLIHYSCLSAEHP